MNRDILFVKRRKEIVDKIEELYKMGREKRLPIEYVISSADALDWCLGENNCLETEELNSKSEMYLGDKNANKDKK